MKRKQNAGHGQTEVAKGGHVNWPFPSESGQGRSDRVVKWTDTGTPAGDESGAFSDKRMGSQYRRSTGNGSLLCKCSSPLASFACRPHFSRHGDMRRWYAKVETYQWMIPGG